MCNGVCASRERMFARVLGGAFCGWAAKSSHWKWARSARRHKRSPLLSLAPRRASLSLACSPLLRASRAFPPWGRKESTRRKPASATDYPRRLWPASSRSRSTNPLDKLWRRIPIRSPSSSSIRIWVRGWRGGSGRSETR